MATMKIGVSRAIMERDRFGQFISAIERAGDDLLEDYANKMSRSAKEKAPVRSGRLRDGIMPVRLGHNEWRVVSTAPHAMPIEKGARPHPISAYVRFFWEKQGRVWMHPDEYFNLTGHAGADPIMHPGNAAQPYLEPAFEQWWPELRADMRRRYPG